MNQTEATFEILKIVQEQPTREDMKMIAMFAAQEAVKEHAKECPVREIEKIKNGPWMKVALIVISLIASALGVSQVSGL